MPRKQSVEDASQPFQSNPDSAFRSGTLGKTVGLATGSFRLWAVVLERGAPCPPFPWGDLGHFNASSGPTTGALAQGPSALQLQHREGKQGAILATLPEICKHSLTLQGSAFEHADMLSPGYVRHVERPGSHTCLQATQTF